MFSFHTQRQNLLRKTEINNDVVEVRTLFYQSNDRENIQVFDSGNNRIIFIVFNCSVCFFLLETQYF
jgi:hypothetical protein